MHDPTQTYASFGSHYGMQTPFGLPYQALQAGINPALALNPLTAALAGIPQGVQQPFGQQPFGQYPGQGLFGPQQQLQNIGALQNPLLAALLSNPVIAAGLLQTLVAQQQQHTPFQQFGQMGNPFGQIGSPFGQIGSPYGQIGSPFGQTGYPLAPQSWIGQGGQQGFGQHPLLQQWGARPFQGQGISPWGY